MREIKFRAWDKVLNEMINSEDASKLSLAISFNGSIYDGACSKDYILDQYTGLKDKNDVDIYEGDIIKLSGNLFIHQKNSEYSLHRVIWDTKEAGFWMIGMEEYEDGKQSRNDLNVRWMNGAISKNHTTEVIGNIHMNPELLEDN